MNELQLQQLFDQAAVTRTSGTPQELACAQFLQAQCQALGLQAAIEPFAVPMARIDEASLTVDGQAIPCRGYLCAGNGEVEAPLVYLPSLDRYSLSQARGCIALIDGGVGYWAFKDLMQAGVVGIISYDGDINYADCDIDQKELRSYVSEGVKLPCVSIHAKRAVELVRSGAKTAKIVLRQTEWEGQSQNVVLDLPGQSSEQIILTAHYDSTWLSSGAYDNLSGSLGLLGIAEHFLTHPHQRSLRFIWCGSEERGLLGSKAYVRDHAAELDSAVLNINLDMIGCIMGSFIACCSTEDKLVTWLDYFSCEEGFPLKAYQDVYSSDSTPFADQGVPALSFARATARGTGTIHNRYDTTALMSMPQMLRDIAFISSFTGRMANAAAFPVGREIPESVKEKLDVYLNRKRKQ